MRCFELIPARTTSRAIEYSPDAETLNPIVAITFASHDQPTSPFAPIFASALTPQVREFSANLWKSNDSSADAQKSAGDSFPEQRIMSSCLLMVGRTFRCNDVFPVLDGPVSRQICPGVL